MQENSLAFTSLRSMAFGKSSNKEFSVVIHYKYSIRREEWNIIKPKHNLS